MRYVIYARKSTDTEDKQVLSLESQINELKDIAEKEGLDVVDILQESMSAKAPGRPIFQHLVSLFSQNQADAILCWKLDRLSRNSADSGQIQWMLQEGRIKTIRTYEREYLPSDNVLLMNVELGMANQYVRDLSTNVKRGNRAKLERGEWPNHAPLGYLNDKATKKIVIDERLSKYVKRAFELYVTGRYCFKEISDVLYSEGLRTRSGKKVFKGSIQRMINNPFYSGIMERDGKLYPGIHKPIISTSVFEKAKEVAEERTRPRRKKLFFPLRGYLVCDTCGCQLTASLKKGHKYYYCTNGKGICNEHKKYLREDKIDEMFVSVFDKINFDEELIDLMYDAAKEKIAHKNGYRETVILDLKKKLNSVELKEARLVDSFIDGITPKDIYEKKLVELQNEKVALSSQLTEFEKKSRNGYHTLEQTKKIFLEANRAKKEYLSATPEKKYEIVGNLVWNLSISDQDMKKHNLKSPYSILSTVPKNASFPEMLRD
jgi:site-specific DNA recombinase